MLAFNQCKQSSFDHRLPWNCRCQPFTSPGPSLWRASHSDAKEHSPTAGVVSIRESSGYHKKQFEWCKLPKSWESLTIISWQYHQHIHDNIFFDFFDGWSNCGFQLACRRTWRCLPSRPQCHSLAGLRSYKLGWYQYPSKTFWPCWISIWDLWKRIANPI